TLLLVCKELLELTLLVAKTLDARRHPRWRHAEQNIGAIHPVDMRHHRVKATRGDILEAQVLLDRFAQFITVCRRSKWSIHRTKSPFLALLAIVGSKAAYKISSACSNAFC